MVKRLMPAVVVASVLALLPLTGCGGRKETATVKGKVMYKDYSLPYGKVLFYGESGMMVGMSDISPDGSYKIAGLSPGSVGVVVRTDMEAIFESMKSGSIYMPPGMEMPKDMKGAFGKDQFGKMKDMPKDMGGKKGMPKLGGTFNEQEWMAKMKARDEILAKAPPELADTMEKIDAKYSELKKGGSPTYQVVPGVQDYSIILTLS